MIETPALLSVDDWVLSTDFEGGTAEAFEPAGKDAFRIRVRQDPAVDPGQPYAGVSYNFAVRVANRGRSARTAHFDIEGINHRTGPRATVWVRKRGAFRPLPGEVAVQQEPIRLSFDLPVSDGTDVIVSNGFPIGPEEVQRALDEAVRAWPGASELRSIGRTHEGREIGCLSLAANRNARPRVLVKGTFQPSEMGAWGALAALRWLLERDALAQRLTEAYRVDLIPLPNPDGAAHGLCMANASGENPMFEFSRCARGEPVCSETRALWDWTVAHRPVAALGYHSYYQTSNFFWATPRRVFGPYLFDVSLLRTDAAQELQYALADALLSLPTGTINHVPVGSKNFQHAFPYVLQEQLDVPGFWYKLHTSVSLARSERRAAAAFRAMARVLVGR